ncbi:ABC transporter permease [Bacillus aerolatus]|uniref:ABC transporter permease n=1 Tax=Bacillus aerolatus TaxID=2653354 RepID=A0A6I1FGQ0_9BACI|nr:ABC transporter permease [Bacillus aerolatus]KAB7704954.1 ABC transporter permease [Bacillus aerolatus]
MKTIDQLWKSRIEAYYKELRKYLRYMLNDHLLFVLVFGLGAVLYYYSGWVKTLDETFPAPLVMAVILGALLAWSSVYTFLMRADTVFLLPLEERMAPYFRKAIFTSFISQSYLLIAVLALFMPLYMQVRGGSMQSFFLWVIILAVMKGWNLIVRWHVLKIQEKESRQIDWIVRFALNGLLLYFVFSGASILFILIVAALMAAYLAYFKKIFKRMALKWETLVQLEEKRMAAFYRLANLFTDVPHLRGTVKRRKWLDGLLGSVPFDSAGTYTYLFRRTFVRMNEFFGLYIRLTVIAALIIGFSDQAILQLIISWLFIYLTGFQLLPMIRRHEMKIWVSLYPVAEERKSTSLLSLIGRLLFVQAIIFSAAAWAGHSITHAGIVLAAGLAFAFFFAKVYAPSRLNKLVR